MRYTLFVSKTPSLLYRLPQNLAECFKGKYLVLQLLAILLSILIVMSNLDWVYFQASRSTLLRTIIFPAIALGGLVPIIVPLSLLFFGMIRKKAYLTNAAWGLTQSAMLGLFISSFYKAFTGRIPPRFADAVANLADASHGFQFGFLRGGVFWGWPSSHTTVAFAMATTFVMLFPKQRALKCLAFLYAAYVAFGVSVSIHWLSEAVMGVALGTVIGLAVGASFRRRRETIEAVTPKEDSQ